MPSATLPPSPVKSNVFFLCLLTAFVMLSWRIYFQYYHSILDLAKAYTWKPVIDKWYVYIAVVVPPIAGWLADRFQPSGKNYSMVSVGMVVTALLLFVLAYIAGNPLLSETISNFLPVVMIARMMGVIFFFSPALFLIRSSAHPAQWLTASAWVMFAGQLFYALGNYGKGIVDQIGIAVGFATAGIVLTILAIYHHRIATPHLPSVSDEEPKIPMDSILKAAILGFVAGVAKAMIFSDYVILLSASLGGIHAPSAILFFSALLILYFLWKCRQMNLLKSFWIGFALVLFGFIFIKIISLSMIGLLQGIILIVGTALLSFAIYPLAMQNVSSKHANLILGILFGSFALAGWMPFNI